MIDKFDKAKYKMVAEQIANQLDEDKASDIITIDLEDRTDIAFYMVVATGRSSRHVTSIANKLIDIKREEIPRGVGMEGMETGQWVLIDFGGVIVHIFQHEARDLYRIEDLWDMKPTGK